MRTTLLKLIVLVLFAPLLPGCMVSGGLILVPEPVVIGDPPRKVEHRSKHHRKGRKHYIKIPPGHMPPPGKCRIWYYDRPPGHQPPPVSCHRVKRGVPYGAIVAKG